jgi:hypothetical protein
MAFVAGRNLVPRPPTGRTRVFICLEDIIIRFFRMIGTAGLKSTAAVFAFPKAEKEI